MGFLQSNPSIYKTKIIDQDSYFGKLVHEDYGGMFGFLQEKGYIFDQADGRWRVPGTYKSIMSVTPWCHAKGTPQKHCGLDHDILFNHFHIIPPRCLQCWKVVVTPRTFDELLKLEQLEKELDVPCKCGIELRDYTPKHYGGYFYNNSLDEGRECLDVVQNAVKERLSEETADSVILKRGCTEYEMIKGPSPYWHITDEEEEIYEVAQALVAVPRGHSGQSELQKRMVRIKWFLFAHMNGDFTYTQYNGGKKMFPDYIKYNDGDIEVLKKDLMMAHAHAKYGTPLETSSQFIDLTNEFAEKNKLVSGKLGASLGWDRTNSYRYEGKLQEVPENLKGDQDELT